MLPCNRTLSGQKCTLSVVSASGALGLAMGGVIGAQSQESIVGRFENAGVGTLIGAVAGLGLRRAVRLYNWGDVAAVAMLGGAIGAAPRQALAGLGIGTVAGVIVYAIVPKSGVPDVIMFGLAGLAIGGLSDWGVGAGVGDTPAWTAFSTSFSIAVR